MDPIEWIDVGISALMLTLLTVYVMRRARARRLARATPAVQACVVSVSRDEDSGDRAYKVYVDTRYEVPGRGVLKHRKGFDDAGRALLFSRLHREGSTHWVVPDEVDREQVFLLEDLKSTDWKLVILLGMGMAVTAWGLWRTAVEYFTE